MAILKSGCLLYVSVRNYMKPQSNIPFLGIYRTDNEAVRKDDIILVQRKMNYHPGLNVYCKWDRGSQNLLKADCEGTVMITREKVHLDETLKHIQAEYAEKGYENIYKLCVNVIPPKISNKFVLVSEK